MDQTTLLNNLSAAIQATLNNLQSSEMQETTSEMFSALQQLSANSPLQGIDGLICSLTSIPMHPYQNLIWKHFEPDYKFKTIDEVPEPEEIPLDECVNYLAQKEKELNKTMFHNLTCCPEHQLQSAFEYMSGDQVVCNVEKQKNYLEFFEMVRQIPLDSITTENSPILAKKLVSEFIKVL